MFAVVAVSYVRTEVVRVYGPFVNAVDAKAFADSTTDVDAKRDDVVLEVVQVLNP